MNFTLQLIKSPAKLNFTTLPLTLVEKLPKFTAVPICAYSVLNAFEPLCTTNISLDWINEPLVTCNTYLQVWWLPVLNVLITDDEFVIWMVCEFKKSPLVRISPLALMFPLAVMFPKALIWLAAESKSISLVTSKCKSPPGSISKLPLSEIFEPLIVISSTVKVVSVPNDVMLVWAAVVKVTSAIWAEL